MSGDSIYVDYGATTPCLPEVVEAMLPYFTDRFHNPQSLHSYGEEAQAAVEEARREVARLIGARSPAEVVFTSGATESNNWALKGIAQMPRRRGSHIVTSQIEHFSVQNPCRTLERSGFEVTYLPVDADGLLSPARVADAIRADTALVSLNHASVEIGTVQPLAPVGALCRQAGVPFHVDATNTAGILPLNVEELQADLLTVSPHMFYGPKGVGALYVKRGLRLPPLLDGGTQEDGRRGGTENVPAIVGFGVAAQVALRDMSSRMERATALRDTLLDGLAAMEGVRPTGHRTQRLPHHASCVVDHVEGESLLLSLSIGAGIHAASGSACSAKALKHSYVLQAIGIGEDQGVGSLVFTVGLDTTQEAIDTILGELPGAVSRLRSLSPLAASHKESC